MQVRAGVLLCSLLLIASKVSIGQSQPAQSDRQLSVAQIVRQTSDAVVQVVTFDKSGNELALGSGFVVFADGKIVTNHHVIKGAHSAIAKLANGSFFPVDGVLAADIDRDLVLLKVAGKGLPFLTLDSSTGLEVGDQVVAIGSPLGLEGTVSDGIVSAIRDETPNKSWIQTTAPVSHGNSGGPLLDMRGNVVGVITWGVNLQQGQNLNFAIPSDEVKSLLLAQGALTSIESIGQSQNQIAEGARPTSSAVGEATPPEQTESAQDAGEQHAIEQLRAIAEAIKTCPPDVYKLPPSVTYAGWDFLVTDGPPLNVVWDVKPVSSARARYLGTIEYTFPFSEMPPADLCKRLRISKSHCEFAYESFENDYQREDAYPWQYRFEFDVTPHGLEFLRAFTKTKQTEGESWVPGGPGVCGKRAIGSVLGSTGPSQ